MYHTTPKEIAMAFAFSSLFPLIIWYKTYSKKLLIRNILTYYHKAGISRINLSYSKRRIVNLLILLVILIPFLSAIFCSVSVETDPYMKLYYSFYIDFEENIFVLLIRVIVVQLIFLYQFTFLNIIAVMCGDLYYSFSELIRHFCKDLQSLRRSRFTYGDIYVRMQTHSSLYEMAHKLHNVTSEITCLLLCSYVTDMFVILAVYVLLDPGQWTIPMLWESIPVICLVPFSIVGITLCASRISVEIQKCEIVFQSLLEYLICKPQLNLKSLESVKVMMNKRFPTMTACSIAEFRPKFIVAIFGSFLTYGLLFLNLEKSN
ncbi:uncharacterized protein CDAR_438321 [Caerostris darwini]|uniref:Gustatory receptor n=1 Tax=Caerostris darwini TaxID=1538125 RepID=A0AAV4X3I6_9ARAC|nr:uncharacterized protein CDAR_438321 [Caerostris darwini]